MTEVYEESLQVLFCSAMTQVAFIGLPAASKLTLY